MKNRAGLITLLPFVAALVAGCAPVVSGLPETSFASASHSEPIVHRQVCSVDGTAPRTAFFLTISGGGSRAAYLGARVISELQDVDGTDVASHINVISSVSGGSLAAALYGISTDRASGDGWRPVWNDSLIRTRLAENLKVDMAEQLANPVFLGGYIFGHTDRTDAFFTALDSTVLFGVSPAKRMLTLGDFNPNRPQIVINSTVATAESTTAFRPRPFGSLFTFSQSDLDSIGVDYSTMPLSRAVAASAAFPGLLSPVVLNRFQLGSTEKELGSPRYIHLIDGGNVDNLGLLAVKRALIEDSHRLLTDCDQIVVVTVDAFGAQGFHPDDKPSMRSASGWVLDEHTLLAAFDALLAANRTRLLAEFKSRMFTPPADSEQCRKDDLPPDICGGGVRVNWDDVNTLLKRKLYFVHLSLDSSELAEPPVVTYCDGKYGDPDPKCHEPPINRWTYYNEERALRRRLKQIPTTFGLSRQQQSDISMYVKLQFNPGNVCLMHLRDLIMGTAQHSPVFYEIASDSCDETTSFTDAQMTRRRSHEEIFGDRIATPGHNVGGEPAIEEQHYAPMATVEAREAFWKDVLRYYGWNGTEVKRQ
ncbi:patatin [Paraburkholderia phytofirmans OLGA172]|uniref:Patatin n=1 Tax=Paraburkholderia phytofirmans OLGA172 TaxID=1417228 RepID=A0A160FN46_9BURK|nr:patatin-like phospholipase family protein [Paraburkholderia phytofirmans]ANB73716.1 patatin [Paraburkholderia phytofirmans OLGA172]